MQPINFTCPYCNQPTTITEPNIHNSWEHIEIKKELQNYGKELGVGAVVIACPNPKCKGVTLTAKLTGAKGHFYQAMGSTNWTVDTEEINQDWRLLPQSNARPQPDYIPKQIVDDYTEACLIKDLSPKASATLARRCLQGMIRDFHSVKKNTLNDEITELKGRIPNDEWNALDALRKIGNIGSHMEKDVNLIIDIKPDEADKLIAFIEYLFKQWYVKRHDDQENLASVQALAGIKTEQKKASKN